MSIPRTDITGLVLAGGRGSRMGGVDKGLEAHAGLPLARHALLRLGPQVGRLMISANRHLGEYASMGVPVWPDGVPGFAGPLAGWMAGLAHCETPWMVSVPCDSPHFPVDLVSRLAAAAVAAGAPVAMAATREGDLVRPQPVFTLMHISVLDSLAQHLQRGEHTVQRWARSHPCVDVVFDDPSAFANANTLDELRQLSGG